MNICILGTTLPPLMGGIEMHVWEMARFLSQAGHSVSLVGYGRYFEHSFKEEEKLGDLRVYRTKNEYIFPGYTSYLFTAGKKIKALHKEKRIDIIHAHQAYPPGVVAYFLKRNFKIPYIVTSHGQDVLVRVNDIRFRPLIKLALKHSSKVIGVSQELADQSIAYGAVPDKTIVMANAVDIKRFYPWISADSIRNRYNIRYEEIVILTLRRLVPKTGVQYLIEVAPELLQLNSNLRFLIVGEGELKQQLINRTEELGIENSFIFTGSVDNKEIPEYIAASDLSVFLSLAEATSIACLEVMACGKPVVVSNVGGLPEIVNDGVNGFVVDFPTTNSTYTDYGLPMKTLQNILRTLKQLVNSSNLRKELGDNAAQTVRLQFSWDAYITNLLKIYKEVIQ